MAAVPSSSGAPAEERRQVVEQGMRDGLDAHYSALDARRAGSERPQAVMLPAGVRALVRAVDDHEAPRARRADDLRVSEERAEDDLQLDLVGCDAPAHDVGVRGHVPCSAVSCGGKENDLREGGRFNPGPDLFSRGPTSQVSSALAGLTAVFGMGTGVASPLESPGFFCCDDVTGCDATGTIRPRAALESMGIFAFCPRRPVPATRWDPRSLAAAHWSAAEVVKPSTISTAQLRRSPDFHMPPIKQVVYLRSYPVDPVGNLILRRASHLDAFSAYPDRT